MGAPALEPNGQPALDLLSFSRMPIRACPVCGAATPRWLEASSKIDRRDHEASGARRHRNFGLSSRTTYEEALTELLRSHQSIMLTSKG
jgi:hypothetical protein